MDITSIKDLVEAISALQEKNLNARIEVKLAELAPKKSPQKSLEINELACALSKAQSEMETAEIGTENPYFKSRYADLTSIVNASRPALTKNGLAVIQQVVPSDDSSSYLLTTTLVHSSGQWIGSEMRIAPTKTDVQSIGSYITYLRRYSYAALVGVVAAGEDDDGEKTMERIRGDLTKPNLNSYKSKDKSFEFVTKEQIEELDYELKDMPELAEDIMQKMHIQSLADMPKEMYTPAIRRIRQIKADKANSKA